MSSMQFCTLSSRQYLPFARVLATSITAHHPDAEVFVLLAGDLDHEIDPGPEPFTCLHNEDLGIDSAELHRLYTIHGTQFFPAIKPFLLEYLLRANGLPTFYVDSDIAVYAPLDDLGALAAAHGVVLTPHVRRPLPQDGRRPDDTTILTAGIFNAGFIGVGPGGLGLLEFLKTRLRRECLEQPQLMRVNEQRWLDFAPAFFDCHVVRDPGVNAAYWNLHEAPLHEVDGRPYTGDVPLRALHFSGFDPTRPDVLSRHCPELPRVVLEQEPVLAELCRRYAEAVLSAGFSPGRMPIGLEELPGGIAPDGLFRSVYQAYVVDAEANGRQLPPDAYEPAERPAFLAWTATAYRANNLEPPSWAVGGGSAAQAPGAPAKDCGPAPAAAPAPAQSEQGGLEELVRRLAQTSGAAIANLDQRLAALEQKVGELDGRRVAS